MDIQFLQKKRKLPLDDDLSQKLKEIIPTKNDQIKEFSAIDEIVKSFSQNFSDISYVKILDSLKENGFNLLFTYYDLINEKGFKEKSQKEKAEYLSNILKNSLYKNFKVENVN